VKLYLQAIVTILSLINPVICGAIFEAAEAGRSRPARVKDAGKAALSILAILAVAALFGVRVLDLFGISLDVFSMVGGGVLVWMGFSMMRTATAPKAHSSSLASLVVFAASPGTIAGVIAISVAHAGRAVPVTALVGIVTATLVTWLFLVTLARRTPKAGGQGEGFMHAVLQSFMGLIVMAMGLQIALKGLSTYFNLALN
jgi:multiple antibiotic resistance protein